MDSNLDEDHAKCVGESSHPKDPQASKCLHEPMLPYFLAFIIYVTNLNVNMVN